MALDGTRPFADQPVPGNPQRALPTDAGSDNVAAEIQRTSDTESIREALIRRGEEEGESSGPDLSNQSFGLAQAGLSEQPGGATAFAGH